MIPNKTTLIISTSATKFYCQNNPKNTTTANFYSFVNQLVTCTIEKKLNCAHSSERKVTNNGCQHC